MQQFEDRSLCARIHECLNRCGLNPDQLKIEVTERVLLQDMDYMKRMMEEMTGEGFGFYLDDFGTGYSNISCALSLPFEYIKLDRSLLVRLPGDSKVQVFVRSMVETFHAMGQKLCRRRGRRGTDRITETIRRGLCPGILLRKAHA